MRKKFLKIFHKKKFFLPLTDNLFDTLDNRSRVRDDNVRVRARACLVLVGDQEKAFFVLKNAKNSNFYPKKKFFFLLPLTFSK